MFEAELPWQKAAQAIEGADALLFTAGAGMGVDSGLPDFRGDTGFWRAYPPFQQRGLSFTDVAQPRLVSAGSGVGMGVLWASSAALSRYEAACRLRCFASLGGAETGRSFRLHLKCGWAVSASRVR